jgi:hypothetical protein
MARQDQFESRPPSLQRDSERAHALYFKCLRRDLDSMLCPVPQVEITHRARRLAQCGHLIEVAPTLSAGREL